MAQPSLSEAKLAELMDLLEQRIEVIGDAKLREREPKEHLEKLQDVSETIMAFHERHRDSMPPRLDHFLENASYGKALDWARGEREK